jgi:hypothetical protein
MQSVSFGKGIWPTGLKATVSAYFLVKLLPRLILKLNRPARLTWLGVLAESLHCGRKYLMVTRSDWRQKEIRLFMNIVCRPLVLSEEWVKKLGIRAVIERLADELFSFH